MSLAAIRDTVFSSSYSIEEKTARVNAILESALAMGVVDEVKALVSFVVDKLGEQHPLTHPFLTVFIKSIEQIDDNDLLDDLCQHTISLLTNKTQVYGEQTLALSMMRSEIYQAQLDWKNAAQVLAIVDLAQIPSITTRVDVLLRMAELNLEGDDAPGASRAVTRAHRLITQCQDNIGLVLRHKRVYAQVLDSERKFMEAALRYLSLAQVDQPNFITDDDQMMALQHAATCVMLAGAGPSRSRVLGLIYSDNRAPALPNYRMLEAMYCNQIIGADQRVQFKELLRPHQDADLSGGSSILKRAVLEHNMLAISKLYDNIGLASLSETLGVSVSDSESIAAVMIEQGRMAGSIDQVEGRIRFFRDGEGSSLYSWDQSIHHFCLLLNGVANRIADEYPEIV